MLEYCVIIRAEHFVLLLIWNRNILTLHIHELYMKTISLKIWYLTTISAQFVRMDVTIRIHAHAKRIFRNLPYIDRQNKTKVNATWTHERITQEE